jgi:hypothetical protein
VAATPTAIELDKMPLARLASLAAIELDNLALGAAKTIEAVTALARMLRSKGAAKGLGVHAGALADPTTAVAISKALTAAKFPSPKTIDQLIEEAEKVVETLEQSDPSGEVVQLRAFCVALSKAASRNATLHHQPAHPSRL